MTKEVKQFFYNNNYLNKGATKLEDNLYVQKVREEFNTLMPAPEILQAYEEVMPGTISKLINLIEQEQKHKHIVEEIKISMRTKAEFMGRLFSAFTILTIGYVTINLSHQSLNHAIIFAAVAFTSIFGISIVLHYKDLVRNHQKSKHIGKINTPSVEKNEHHSSDKGQNWHNNQNNYRKPIYKKKST
jgi:uncharacterized membrane protein